MNKDTVIRLLVAAGILMFLSGVLFAVLRILACAVLVWVGAVGCMAAVLSFKNRKD